MPGENGEEIKIIKEGQVYFKDQTIIVAVKQKKFIWRHKAVFK